MKMEEIEANNNNNNGSQDLETEFAERSMWLMKCPSRQPLPLADDPVAKVILSIDPLPTVKEEESKVVMELARGGSGNVPKRFGLDMSKDFIPMSVFSESSPQGTMSVEGKIKDKFHMNTRTENMESYGKLCRERASKYMCKNKQIQVIDNATGMHMWPTPGTITPEKKKKVTNKAWEMKRTRRGRREMEEIMFNLFEGQSNWTLRQLIQGTDQPEQFLKGLLRDLCIYNNKGSNQGTYELKPEFKKAIHE